MEKYKEPTRTYRRPVPNSWWLHKKSYFLFMLREFSSFFVAFNSIVLIGFIYSLGNGRDAYNGLLATLRSGWMILLYILTGLFVLYHMVTWFKISGRIFGMRPLTPGMVTVVNYIVWIIVSIGVAYLIVSI